MTPREMAFGDLPEVMELERLLFPEDAWSERTYREELASGDRYYVVIEEAGRIAGWAGLAAPGGRAGPPIEGGQSDVLTIGVRPELQGRGIGARLLTALLEEAVARGCVEVFLDVRADNDRARSLYERYGFSRVGVRRRYYQPSGVDAIVMARKLGDGFK